MFDFLEYIKTIVSKNRFAQQLGFGVTTCSGIGYLEGVLAEQRSRRAMVCVSDTCEESRVQRGGAWFTRRLFTVFIVSRYNLRDRVAYHEALGDCRELFRQMHSYMLNDEARLHESLTYLGVGEVRSREFGGDFLNGATGLLFLLPLDEPTDLSYKSEEWTS